MPSGQRRRSVRLLLIGLSAILSFTLVYYIGHRPTRVPIVDEFDLSPETLSGDVIASKLGNETLKAELGRAAWKLFHTTMARFPDQPQPDEKKALASYIHLFARLYPCGECASHFQRILRRFPPQVSSRSTAAAWACHVHNEVNRSLGKELFDCSMIGDFYDCGCADDGDGPGRPATAVQRLANGGAHDVAPPQLKVEGSV